jgi:NADH-quinone oxidoreductase subunit I
MSEQCKARLVNFIKKTFFADFIRGLYITFSYNFEGPMTLKYPDSEKWIPYQRFRGLHTLNKNAEGKELCVACELCSRACPTDCITVVPEENDTGRGIADRVAKVWKVDLTRCMFCGYCEDACPTTAVRLGREFELACTSLDCGVRERDELLIPQPVPEALTGGVVAKAKFIKSADGIKVVAELGKTKQRKL